MEEYHPNLDGPAEPIGLAMPDTARNNSHRTKPWNITQLAYELKKDLLLCQTDFERTNCRAVYSREIRGLRDIILTNGRKFTPGEVAVLQGMGICLS